jgi:hypothetical protein
MASRSTKRSRTAAPPPLHKLESEVMELWAGGEASVRSVMEALNARARKERAYTTYMTTSRSAISPSRWRGSTPRGAGRSSAWRARADSPPERRKDFARRGVFTSMTRKRPSAVTRISDLIDAVMDGYVHWREESAAVEAAYRSWRQAAPDERAIAFDTYSAALDREEDAASEYRRLVELAEAA